MPQAYFHSTIARHFNAGFRQPNNEQHYTTDMIEKEPGDDLDDEMRPGYDQSVLKNGVRGKYLAQYRSGTNLVLLDADVTEAYPTAEAVNDALRRLMQPQEAV